MPSKTEQGLPRMRFTGLFLGFAVMAAGPAAAEGPRVTPSGLEVPRYVSLKYAEVNARKGPDEAHQLLWIYRAKGLPVQIVAETREWRRICDPEGGLAWVHKRTVDGRRSAMRVQPTNLPLLKSPKDGAKVTAYLKARGVAALDKCEKGWCRLRADGASGWAREGDIWGADPAVQCRED
ncbi:SH3 domain-containing protein [uncultured Caulobacter sp.]|uniref:SH3 domain-containing protein n=1 Tax=uncultured Caulobacter sp. TaxID=158749 RepID=UPI0026305B72|nr:SH3 domain-containing protein [uncultured Caulobacter sp.]